MLSWCVGLCVMHWKHDRVMAACCFIQIQVIDEQLIIAVVAVGKRERSDVYNLASERMR